MLHDEDLSYQLCQSHSHLPGEESEILQNALYNFYNHLSFVSVVCVSVHVPCQRNLVNFVNMLLLIVITAVFLDCNHMTRQPCQGSMQ